MSIVRQVVRQTFRLFGVNVTRLPVNRFDAMPEVLRRLADQGYRPAVIVDTGANRGQWASIVSRVFPGVPLHCIEAQAACRGALDAFASGRGMVEIHQIVVTKPGVSEVAMVSAGGGSTGAHVPRNPAGRTDVTRHPATTVDRLLASRIRETDRVLMKLDVEGHELDVLAGAQALLPRVDVIVSEVTFFDVEHAGNPTFLAYATALSDYGFVLYDFAALASRARDGRLRMGDAVFVRRGSALIADDSWA